MTILLNSIYRFNTISIKLPMAFFTELGQKISQLIWKHKRPQKGKAILKEKNGAGGINLLTSDYTTKLQSSRQYQSVQSVSRVWLFATPWIAACQASLSIPNSRHSLKLMSIESVMPSSHLILCRPLLLLPPIPPSIKVFSNESTLRMRWPKYCSFSFSISPSK